MHKIAIIVIFAVLTGCAIPEVPTATPLEIQAMQTREFEADKDAVITAVMSGMQNMGISIESADREGGFISARYLHTDTHVSLLGTTTTDLDQKITAVIQELPNGRVRVRLNVVNTMTFKTVTPLSPVPQINKATGQLIVAEGYEPIFEAIRTALFVEGK